MTDLSIPNGLAERLHAIAQREQRPIEEVLADLVAQYEARSAESESVSRSEALAAMKGMFDDEREPDLEEFVSRTYGSLAHDPIERGEQPPIDIRDEIE